MMDVTGSAPQATAQLLESGHISLMHSWVPATTQVVAALVLTLAVGWRSRRWRTVWLPVAAMVLVLGWRGSPVWRRGAALTAVPLCLLSAALVVNLWVGYFPTVQTAWSQLVSGPLPDQTDQATVTAMAAKGTRPPHGSVLPVVIPSDGSHPDVARTELPGAPAPVPTATPVVVPAQHSRRATK